MIVRFIYIGEIVDLHILNFLFMNCNFKQYLTPYVSALLRLSILYTIQDSIVSPIITVIIHHTEDGQNGRVVDVSYFLSQAEHC